MLYRSGPNLRLDYDNPRAKGLAMSLIVSVEKVWEVDHLRRTVFERPRDPREVPAVLAFLRAGELVPEIGVSKGRNTTLHVRTRKRDARVEMTFQDYVAVRTKVTRDGTTTTFELSTVEPVELLRESIFRLDLASPLLRFYTRRDLTMLPDGYWLVPD